MLRRKKVFIRKVRGLKYLRCIAILLTLAVITVAFCSCGISSKTVLENTLKAISAPDFEKLLSYVTDNSLEEIYSMREHFLSLDDGRAEAYSKLMANVGVASYYGETKDSNGNVTLSFRLKHIDVTKLLYDIATEISVSGTPSWQAISDMCSSGGIESYIVYDDIKAELVKADGEFRLKTDGDSELSKALEAVTLLRWLSLH